MNETTATSPETAEASPTPEPVTTRICVTGTPKGGKSTAAEPLAADLGVTARHTDELIDSHKWGEDSIEVASWFDAPGPWVIEGVTVARALRKWFAAHPGDAKPCDVVVLLEHPVQQLTKGQETMRKGIATVWAEVRPQLEARGVEIR